MRRKIRQNIRYNLFVVTKNEAKGREIMQSGHVLWFGHALL
jgi:hypothetical protein